MTENAGLIEPSFQDAIAMIAASEELPEQLKRHWTTSLRQFAKAKVVRSRSSRPATARSGTTLPTGTMRRPG